MSCDSGLRAPESMLDADYAYGMLPCGFVVRAPRGPYLRGVSRRLRRAMDAHWRDVHPQGWARLGIVDAISAD